MTLLELPSELIAHIVEYLDDVDVFSARLSHRTVERACLSHFGQRYFRKRGFLIIGPSLDVLQSIAKHPELRKYTQHVWFNPDYYTFNEPDCYRELKNRLPESINLWRRRSARALAQHARDEQSLSYIIHKQNHERLLSTRELEAKLAVAFEGLPNLMTVGMRRSEDYAPYGWRILKDAIGQDPRVTGPILNDTPSSMLSDPTRLFVAIVKALAGGNRQLERFYTDVIELESIPKKLLSRRKMIAALSSINYVELNIVQGLLDKDGEDWQNSDVSDSNASGFNPIFSYHYGKGLERFFNATPGLMELGLQIFPSGRQSHLVAPTARDPNSWRGSYSYVAFERFTEGVTLSHLTRVKLEKLITSSKILSDFLRPSSKQISSLKLRDIRLLSEKDEPRPWETMFTFLAAQCPRLEHILFYHLMHDHGGISYTEEPPTAPPAGTDADDYIEDAIWPVHTGQAMFAKYDHITMQVDGQEEVRAKLEEIAERHWYHRPLLSYAMDEDDWHTDTSDEDW